MQNSNKLYELRTSRHLTQKEFAEKVGMNAGVYSRYERGENDIPLSVAAKIARAFDVSIDFIAGYSKNEQGIAADKDEKFIEDTIIKPYLANNNDPKEGIRNVVRYLEEQLNTTNKGILEIKKHYNIENDKKDPDE